VQTELADLTDPAVIVLLGAAGSGKSTWAAQHFAPGEIVSSDALRGIVGSGPADLDASAEAFTLLDQIVAGRTKRRLTTVIDTLGLDRDRRLGYLAAARAAELPAIAVVLAIDDQLCRQRNAGRDRPVPAPVLSNQLRAVAAVRAGLDTEGWDRIVLVDQTATSTTEAAATAGAPHTETLGSAPGPLDPTGRVELVLQLSRFPWGADPLGWLTSIARRSDEIGLAGIAVMDHLIQIPQVGRAWEPIPEPWVTLGALAGLGTRLRLGTLVSPVTFRRPGITAKAAASLDVICGGRAFLGLGAGWWDREHAAFGLAFPTARERLDELEAGIETIRALWASGTKAYVGQRVKLPETTCYPRPLGEVPIIVGGSGEQRTLRIAAKLADGCNLPSDPAILDRLLGVLRRHCTELGRDPAELAVTVLDVPVIGRDRSDTARRIEKLRGRTSAATFAARHHAGVADAHRRRYADLAARGVSTVFVALPDLAGPDDLDRLAPLVDAGD
jgi:alkanesulfonate monooxygenase SsuD/methylene tetrahydromethanopterin reductase-like flavin-dependent oxidoreductase (luciferase family)/predicted kinase